MRKDVGRWPGRVEIPLGESRDIQITAGQSYSGRILRIPAHVWRAPEPGPTVFITGAVHGDEINGTGTIREILSTRPFELERGNLILVPVVNLPGFERHSRYLPDRRDLNRCFPGRSDGSLASRLARVVFDEIVRRSDYGIDLHTAALRRTNFPNLRADLGRPAVAELARAFGPEVVMDNRGPTGSLRRMACAVKCPTVLLEAGEPWKVEPAIVDASLRGIRNVLIHLDMVQGKPERPAYKATVRRARWVRADRGGFLQFHVKPGDLVEQFQPIATNTSLVGQEQAILVAPEAGVILGMTTLPSVSPGDPVVNIGVPERGLGRIERARDGLDSDHPHEQLRRAMRRGFLVADTPEAPSDDTRGEARDDIEPE